MRIYKARIVFFLLLFILIAPLVRSVNGQEANGTISGRVTSNLDNLGIRGAVVEFKDVNYLLYAGNCQTDDNGS
jgi:hypothetical protein